MAEITLADVEKTIETVATTALASEQYFCELDSYAGDAEALRIPASWRSRR